MLKVAAVEVDRAAGGPLESEHEPQQGALPGPGLADDSHELPLPGPQRHSVEDQRPVRVVAEGDLVDDDLAVQFLHELPFGPCLGGLDQQRPDLIPRRHHGG